MPSSIPTFRCYKNKAFVGIVSAISETDAHKRAERKYGRCEVIPCTTRKLAPKGRVERADASYTQGRSPYPVGDFEARRQAEIAKWMAKA